MICLIFAIASSTMVSLSMRISGRYTSDGCASLAVNYVVCSLLAACYTGFTPLFSGSLHENDAFLVLVLGLAGGVLYMGSFVLMRYNVTKNGVVLSTTFMKLGVLVPTVMSIAVFREMPGVLQICGLIFALAAIFLVYFEKNDTGAAHRGLLILLLLSGGGADAMSKVYEQLGPPVQKDLFLLYIFFFALLLCLGMLLIKKQRITRADAVAGLLIGVPNYYSARFLLLSLGSVPAVIAYPVYSVGTIVVVMLIGVLLFHEPLSKKQRAALGLIFAALILLNI